MPLITEQTGMVFDAESIHKCDLIRAKHQSWQTEENGIVTAVNQQKLTVLFLSLIANTSNFFIIPVEEVKAGEWEIRWTSDLANISGEGTENDI